MSAQPCGSNLREELAQHVRPRLETAICRSATHLLDFRSFPITQTLRPLRTRGLGHRDCGVGGAHHLMPECRRAPCPARVHDLFGPRGCPYAPSGGSVSATFRTCQLGIATNASCLVKATRPRLGPHAKVVTQAHTITRTLVIKSKSEHLFRPPNLVLEMRTSSLGEGRRSMSSEVWHMCWYPTMTTPDVSISAP